MGSPEPTVEDVPAPIGADPNVVDHDDADSAIDDQSYISSTASLGSTILQFRNIHGRTYHNYEGAEYWGPNDDIQNEGLDITHHMISLAMDNKLFLAPLENPQKVLDVGCGTGLWAIDFADEFPSSKVIGTDISPIQPGWTPANCHFEIDNCELDWTFESNSFDFIHIRGLVGCVQDWPKLYSECLRCLKPGGWLEQTEFALPIASNTGSLPEDCIWHQWGQIFREAGDKMGRTFEVPRFWERWVREAGFPGVLHKSTTRLPIGDWAKEQKWKEVGMFNRASLEKGLEGFASYICTNLLGWESAEVEILLMQVRQAIKNRRLQAYYPLETIYIQKLDRAAKH
jgi:SAM-dependent methyltransferase